MREVMYPLLFFAAARVAKATPAAALVFSYGLWKNTETELDFFKHSVSRSLEVQSCSGFLQSPKAHHLSSNSNILRGRRLQFNRIAAPVVDNSAASITSIVCGVDQQHFLGDNSMMMFCSSCNSEHQCNIHRFTCFVALILSGASNFKLVADEGALLFLPEQVYREGTFEERTESFIPTVEPTDTGQHAPLSDEVHLGA